MTTVRSRVLHRAELLGIPFPDKNPSPDVLTEKDWYALSRHVQGASYQELAQEMGVTYGTISQRVSGAQWKLFRYWDHKARIGQLHRPEISGGVLRPEDV